MAVRKSILSVILHFLYPHELVRTVRCSLGYSVQNRVCTVVADITLVGRRNDRLAGCSVDYDLSRQGELNCTSSGTGVKEETQGMTIKQLRLHKATVQLRTWPADHLYPTTSAHDHGSGLRLVYAISAHIAKPES